jgi:hypothetical protein
LLWKMVGFSERCWVPLKDGGFLWVVCHQATVASEFLET